MTEEELDSITEAFDYEYPDDTDVTVEMIEFIAKKVEEIIKNRESK